MKSLFNGKKSYLISVLSICLVAMICYPFAAIIGYRAVALILLFTVSLLATQLSLYPVLVAAILSALIWDFFYIPPYFTFYVSNPEDVLMLIMYFIIALLNGILTARIRHFEQLARQREERANALKLYDTLFNSISHELRTPIATIIGASDNLLVGNLSEINKKELYGEINIASERLNRLVDNLLNMSRLDSGAIRPKLDWCDINELIYTVINRLEIQLKYHKVEVNLPKNLPLFKLDFGLMEQALYNILFNATIYTPENSKIIIFADYVDNQCVIRIYDNGKGFPKEDLDQIFEKFYRSKGSKAGGIGLGLSITKGFVEAHRGKIKIENQAGGGAEFTIKIPAEKTFGEDFTNGNIF